MSSDSLKSNHPPIILLSFYGQNQTDCQEVHCPKGTQETTCRPKNCQEKCPRHHWSQKTSSLQTRNSRPQGNQEVPEIHWSPHQETALPEAGQRNRSWVQAGTQIPKLSCVGSARSCWGLPGFVIRGHQPVRDPCEASDHNDERSAAGEEDQGRQILMRIVVFAFSHGY